MKVFVSWSGNRSQSLATAVREWLPLVLHYAEPWVSKSDINAGDRWGLEIAKELDGSGFGISCITAENVSAPWLLFEAGALARSLAEGRVVPLLLGLDFSDISGPIAQFQAKKADRVGLLETVNAINAVAATPVPEPKLTQLFDALWPSLEAKIEEIPQSEKTVRSRPQSEILEELVSSVRNLDLRMREDADDGRLFRGSKRTRMRNMMLEDVIFSAQEPPGAMSIIMAASVYRDDFPWVYELASKLAQEINVGDLRSARKTARLLHDSVVTLTRSPIGHEFVGRNMHMLLDVMDRTLGHAEAEKVPAKPRGSAIQSKVPREQG